MPYASDKQRKAMHAAAAGKSTIGIPTSVGKKYTSHGSSHKPSRSTSLRKYGNYTESYGNDTKNGIHHTHWKSGKGYAGSTAGGGSIGSGGAG